MRPRIYTKTSQRFVMYIPNNLRAEIDHWVDKRGMTLAEFGREAFETYLKNKIREEKEAQLAETCRIFESKNKDLIKDWAVLENQAWPQ